MVARERSTVAKRRPRSQSTNGADKPKRPQREGRSDKSEAASPISAEEYADFRSKYESEENRRSYVGVSEHIVNRCIAHKRTHPEQVRLVFSRDPLIKTWESLIKKIDKKRREKDPAYGYDNLDDLIALTVLCPYKSAVKEFISWMRNSFDVQTSDSKAERNDPSGHRAHHYIVQVDRAVLRSFPHFRGVRCEIQIKTVVEEAFDAKTHDLTYKPGERYVSEELKKQFAILGGALGLVDQQSEFLRDLLLAEERITMLRRQGCVLLFVNDKQSLARLKPHVQSDGTLKSDVAALAEKLHKLAGDNRNTRVLICKCATLCALVTEDEFLKSEALRYCVELEASDGRNAETVLNAASLKWALGYPKDAIRSAESAIALSAHSQNRTALLTRAKNDFLYYLADWKALGGKGERRTWLDHATKYVQELLADSDDPAVGDTLGFYWIAFGTTPSQVDEGRRLIARGRDGAPSKQHRDFYRYHEHVALNRLQEMLARDK